MTKFCNESLFSDIANDIETQGYSIRSGAMPETLTDSLWCYLHHKNAGQFRPAGVGRAGNLLHDTRVRRDEIYWLTNKSLVEREWLMWASDLQQYCNRCLLLGLFSFESHIAHYTPGAFYRRHRDAFRGQANRVLSLVVYLNKDWVDTDAGELVLYANDDDVSGIRVLPTWGTIVVFLSEEFPHEVLPAKRDRYSIAGWYRLNAPPF